MIILPDNHSTYCNPVNSAISSDLNKFDANIASDISNNNAKASLDNDEQPIENRSDRRYSIDSSNAYIE